MTSAAEGANVTTKVTVSPFLNVGFNKDQRFLKKKKKNKERKKQNKTENRRWILTKTPSPRARP